MAAAKPKAPHSASNKPAAKKTPSTRIAASRPNPSNGIGGRRIVFLALCSAISGVLTALAFAPYGYWPLAFAGLCAFSIIIYHSRWIAGAAGYGYLFGFGFMGLGLNWMSAIFVEAMFGLMAVEALFYMLFGVLLKVAQKLPWWPLPAAATFIAVEFAFSHFPFDGFGWMRVGYAMIDSPLMGGYPIIGVVGVGFLVALMSQLLAWTLTEINFHHIVGLAAGLVATALICVSGAFLQPQPAKGEYNVGWVQGGAPGGGIFGLGPARTITENETAGTLALVDDIAQGIYGPADFFVWPENGTDLDLGQDAQTAKLVKQALAAIGKPLLVGTILQGPEAGERQTASLYLLPNSDIRGKYIKRGIVPFGEWIPYRDFFLPLIPKLEYVGRQSIAGKQPGVLDLELSQSRNLKLGVLICYDVVFDEYVYDTARNGSEMLVVQSSNAMYQGTGQIEQQFAITRARAAELRQEILVVTTSGISGFIDVRGNVVAKITESGEAHGVTAIPARASQTPALWVAPSLEIALAAISVIFGIIVPLGSRQPKGQPRKRP